MHAPTQDRPQSHEGPHSHEEGPLRPTAAWPQRPHHCCSGERQALAPAWGWQAPVGARCPPASPASPGHTGQSLRPTGWTRDTHHSPPCAQDVRLWVPTAPGDSACFSRANLSETEPSPHLASADCTLALHQPSPQKRLAPFSPFAPAVSHPQGRLCACRHSKPCREPTSLCWEIKASPTHQETGLPIT